MDVIKKDYKFKKVSNFLSQDEIELLTRYTQMFHRHNTTDFDFIQNLNGDTMLYSDQIIESLLDVKLKRMEQETNLKLFPTYSFWRMYTKYADLKKHKDRPSCEISVTVQICSDGTDWPIFIDGTPVSLKNGEAVIYWGTDVAHWREEFEGDYHAQAFLHYVDQAGPYADFKFDKRPLLGMIR